MAAGPPERYVVRIARDAAARLAARRRVRCPHGSVWAGECEDCKADADAGFDREHLERERQDDAVRARAAVADLAARYAGEAAPHREPTFVAEVLVAVVEQLPGWELASRWGPGGRGLVPIAALAAAYLAGVAAERGWLLARLQDLALEIDRRAELRGRAAGAAEVLRQQRVAKEKADRRVK